MSLNENGVNTDLTTLGVLGFWEQKSTSTKPLSFYASDGTLKTILFVDDDAPQNAFY